MSYKFSFEKLEVWQLSKDFVKEIYKITKVFPSNEKYGLVSQINRASVSIASNLAEGSARSSPKDQAHFSQLAYSSMMEVICQLIIAKDLSMINKEKYQNLRTKAEEIPNKINALRNYQINNSTNKL
jgi:four helix bundle protein